MKTFAVIVIVIHSSSLCIAGANEPVPELLVNIGDVVYIPSSPAQDSVIVRVYIENLFEPICGFDLYISISHDMLVRYMSDSVWRCDTLFENCQDSSCLEWIEDSCIAWVYSHCEDTTVICHWVTAGAFRLASPLEDWDLIDATVIGSQRMMLHLFGLAVSGTPIPADPGPGQHLLVELAFEITDTTGAQIDSLCGDADFYDEFGTTIVRMEPISKFSDCGSGLIGWHWVDVCIDSNCIEWLEDSCIAWECIEWDSIYVVDTTALFYFDGSIVLMCEGDCDAVIGDADGSGGIDIDDVVHLIGYIFTADPPPTPYPVASGDAGCDCGVDIDDVVDLIAFIFGSEPPPCSCEEWVQICGPLH
jgi:hypothetical protein